MPASQSSNGILASLDRIRWPPLWLILLAGTLGLAAYANSLPTNLGALRPEAAVIPNPKAAVTPESPELAFYSKPDGVKMFISLDESDASDNGTYTLGIFPDTGDGSTTVTVEVIAMDLVNDPTVDGPVTVQVTRAQGGVVVSATTTGADPTLAEDGQGSTR
jgi:hypothetical protein